MNLLADESVDYAIIAALRNKGFVVRSISEEHPGIKDKEVLSKAILYNCLLLTEDKDFGELTYRRQVFECVGRIQDIYPGKS